MNTIEAAALRALQPYYLAHWEARRADPAGLRGPCECDGCRHARMVFDLLGVRPGIDLVDSVEEGRGSAPAVERRRSA